VGLPAGADAGGFLRWAEHPRLGLVRLIELPSGLTLGAGVVLRDYTLWHWHWLTHRVSGLWRFHLVHHVENDLDASTALRFLGDRVPQVAPGLPTVPIRRDLPPPPSIFSTLLRRAANR
jgi:hypothetical protein